MVTAEDETKYPSGVRFWLILLCNALVLLFQGLDTSIVSTAVPSITDEFHTIRDVGWYSSAFRLCACSFSFMFGKIYSLFPLRPVFLSSVAIFMCGSLLSATAHSSVAFVVSRAICGLGGTGAIQGCFYMLTHVVPLRKRPFVAGALGGVEGVADIAAPSIGGFIIGKLSWRWCFWINIPTGAISFIIIAFTLQIDQSHQPKLPFWQKIIELDLLGNALFVPSLTCLFLALSWAGTTYAWNSGIVVSLFVVFAVLLVLFGYDQYRRGDKATLPPRILSNRSVLAGFIFSSCTNATISVILYYLPTYYQTVREYTATKSGYMMVPCLVGMLVAMVLHGAAVSSVGYYTPFMLFASTMMPIFAGLLTTFTTTTSTGKMLGYTACMGFASGIGFQAPQSAVQTVLPAKDASLGLSVIIFAQQFGPAVFTAAAQSVFLNRLSTNLRVLVPGLSPEAVNNMGLTDIKNLVGKANLERALGIFDTSLMQTWYLAVGLASASMLGSIAMEWRSVKDKKRD
ncbi:MFS general substrate transporter [Cryphonectria parasitica EP155]|uniref:MFS general substrate transporter n=1 Tax=Cryphonectria parasitica (strain ATCC 38755 / EP155) TaxID=660469 RepID=A0A9P4Y000_CRYP1|nr:MFS general substrate transporter [Cryphonectria parasitica EP155]KAF3763885.1 MFS general substrate transporter [Cryphonectria parasitica EP155]